MNSNTENPSRVFFADTPLGQLKVYAKHEKDSPRDYPGVYVDFVGTDGELIQLACVEYNPNSQKIQTCVYGDAFDEEPSHLIYHKNLEYLAADELDRAKSLIDNFFRTEYQTQEYTFENLERVPICYTTVPQNECFGIQIYVDLVNYALNRYVLLPSKEEVLVRCAKYSSLKELNDNELENLDFDELVSFSTAEWMAICEDRAVRQCLKKEYPVGSRINWQTSAYTGYIFTVQSVDEQGHINCVDKNGHSHVLLFGCDNFYAIQEDNTRSEIVMKMKIRAMTPAERNYSYSQSQQIKMQTGMIGYLRGDFDSSGTGFYTTWFDEVESRKTDEFKAEFDEVINALRFDKQYGGLLAGRSEMQKYGRSFPDSIMEGNYTTEYGFRIDTSNFAYLLRCIPVKGDYNFYCWCFEGKWLDRHLEQAQKGIRFINPNYKELFRIPDGDKIRIIYADGEKSDHTCRYIDDYHVEIGSGWNSLLHICQFAEMMERNGSKVIPLRSSLPEQCYSVLPDTGELIFIKKGESGYYRTDIDMGDKAENRALADEYNAKLGVSKAQEQAMSVGSMCGWQVPGADPKNYDESGHPLQP